MRLPLKHITILGALPALTACGEHNRNFYADPHGANSSSASTGAVTTGGMSSGAGDMASNSSSGVGTKGTATSSTVNASGSASTASGTGGSASTGSANATSTTGNVNDPDCPEVAPEATSACLVMVGLSCSYGEVTCVCSGITWNCVGGDSEDTPGAAAGALTTAGTSGSSGTTSDAETATTNGSESRFR